MSADRPEVPAEIEEFLIGLYARAGQIGGGVGGAIGGGLAGGFGGGRGGARGGARGAARMPTKVEERSGDVPGSPEQVVARLTAAFPRASRLPANGNVRLAVPVGVTGLQQIVIDLEFRSTDSHDGFGQVRVLLRGFGKEGIISSKPTRTVTDKAWSAVLADHQS